MTVAQAVEAYLADAVSRSVEASTLKKLHKNPTIHTLAIDLKLKVTTDPVVAINENCHSQVKRFLRDFPHCATLNDLLAIAAQRLGAVSMRFIATPTWPSSRRTPVFDRHAKGK